MLIIACIVMVVSCAFGGLTVVAPSTKLAAVLTMAAISSGLTTIILFLRMAVDEIVKNLSR